MIIIKVLMHQIIYAIGLHNGANFIIQIHFLIIFIQATLPMNHLALANLKIIMPERGAMHFL